ncbi:MAG: hypothetical protein H8D42_05980, partial [Candidatus Marinimicrobia bacterium]|nr:hypothetical protein [Candidatus Neomarinimicrobiota bacterium]
MNRKNFLLKAVLLFAFTIVFCSSANSAYWVPFNGSSPQEYQVNVLSSDDNATVLQFDFPGMFVEEVRIGGEIYHDLKFYSFATTQDVGLPALPIVAEMAAIPGTKNVKASITKTSTAILEGYHVIPFQTPTKDDNPSTNFDIDRAMYSTNAWYPEVTVNLGEIGILRDLRIVPVRVNPFRYNPVTGQLEVATSMTVKLEYYGHSDQSVKTTPVTELTPDWMEKYRSTVVNFDNLNIRQRPGTDEFQVKYLIICPEDAVSIVQPLADFRNA